MVIPISSSSSSSGTIHDTNFVTELENLSLSSSSSSSAVQPWRTVDYDYVYDFLLLDGTRIEEEDDSRARTPEAIAAADRCFEALNFDKSCPKPGFHVPPTVEHGMKISQSCNGLLCCTRLTEVDYGIEVPGIFTTHAYIYNPTTRKYRILPPSPFRDVVRDDCCFEVCSISLAFDPIKSPDYYQVVCIWKDIVNRYDMEYMGDAYFELSYYIEIYSSKTNTWRKLISSSLNPFRAGFRSFTKSGVYWNGSLHWIRTEDCIYESSMYFDIEQELVKPLPLPVTPSGDKSNAVYFGECGGHLYLIEVLASCYTYYNILKMETDYSGWKLIHRLDLERFIAAYPWSDTYGFNVVHDLISVVLFLEEDEEGSLSKLLVLVDGKKVGSYDVKELSITKIHTFSENVAFGAARTGGLFGYLHYYIESLVCV